MPRAPKPPYREQVICKGCGTDFESHQRGRDYGSTFCKLMGEGRGELTWYLLGLQGRLLDGAIRSRSITELILPRSMRHVAGQFWMRAGGRITAGAPSATGGRV